MTNIVRFAPSPTGQLHIGGARTALFNYLFAKATKGKFLLRVEDTDVARSTEDAKQVIVDGLRWLGLDYDDEIIYQSANIERHKEVAHQLLAEGKAYYCYSSKEELDELRQAAQNNNQRFKYDNRWRDAGDKTIPQDVQPVIRIKAPLEGETVIEDLVQGRVVVQNSELDDFVILRGDGTPTYMLAVVVDDYDMNITHIIRGDDHLTNSTRQKILFEALVWQVPQFAHIPLIYGEDGKKMSKRHGATALTDYADAGYLPEAVRNYLLRLGWSHGDDEIISDKQAQEWFNIEAIGKSPARFDRKKLDNLNAYYLRQKPNVDILELILPFITGEISDVEKNRILKMMNSLKERAIFPQEIANSALFLLDRELILNDKAQEILSANKELLAEIIGFVGETTDFDHQALYEDLKAYVEAKGAKLKDYAQVIRAALTGSNISPSIFEAMEVLGKEEVLKRLV
jgi:glutamyl-tRNA synthetase